LLAILYNTDEGVIYMNDNTEENAIDPRLFETNDIPMYQYKRDYEDIAMNAWGWSKERAYSYVSDLDKYKIELLEKEKERLKLVIKEMKESVLSAQLSDDEWTSLGKYCLRYGRQRFEIGQIDATDYSDCHIPNPDH